MDGPAAPAAADELEEVHAPLSALIGRLEDLEAELADARRVADHASSMATQLHGRVMTIEWRNEWSVLQERLDAVEATHGAIVATVADERGHREALAATVRDHATDHAALLLMLSERIARLEARPLASDAVEVARLVLAEVQPGHRVCDDCAKLSPGVALAYSPQGVGHCDVCGRSTLMVVREVEG